MRRRMTVAHALTMQLGTTWNESISYADPRNSECAMEAAADRYRFVLDRPMVAEPGTQWVYNGGATAVLAKLISQGSGRDLLDYADEKLFRPLDIADADWIKGADGEHAAASGLRMRPRDRARIGQLVVNGGRWGKRQVVPADWLEASCEPRSRVEEGLGYDYHWCLGLLKDGGRWVAAFGNGGQRLFCALSLDLLVVVLAGSYNQPDAWQPPVAVITKIVLPTLRGA